ncbi:MAG: YciI family protein [Opitutaceae bacterium]|nr:YciI family protein [Opitutaceae bacterium]
MRIGFAALCCILAAAKPGLRGEAEQAAPPPPLQEFLCILNLDTRYHPEEAWTKQDSEAVSAHFKRLKEAASTGRVILAGKTSEPNDKTIGIVLLRAPGAEEADAFIREDPAVAAGIMKYELRPIRIVIKEPAR